MKKVILITGISSGFGKHTASLLAKNGYIVYGTVRKMTESEPGINVLEMDLLNPESIQRAVKL
ncbi:MAG: NAD-dependent epimerase/dehydratase family protein, partial [Ignavibacteriales bacterium]